MGESRRSDSRAVIDLARQLGALMKEFDLAEIEASVAGLQVRLQRPGAAPAIPVPMAATATPATSAVVEIPTSATVVTMEAPMVGTFYRASSPTAEPYVREGDVVKQGQVICIIEAMKLMNEIEAKASGRIEKILVENGQAVEYGQPLFLIEPAG